MATWADIRELADKLKTTQEKASSLNLSERTWVDIVRHLVNTHRLKLIFTSDGRSYLTRQELEKEIRDEVEAHSGRVSLTEIASNLDVDPLVIEARVSDMLSADSEIGHGDKLISLPGELINSAYVRQLAHEIQDILEERGQITVGELATNFSLPTSFLTNVVDEYQGILFRVHKYGEKYITNTFLAENRAKIRGYFVALTRPVTLNFVANKIHVPESLLSSIVASLISNGQIYGALIAGRGTYVPSCYTVAEDTYVNSFYSQNGYVEWSYLKRLGIADPGSYLRSLLPNATHLTGLSVGPMILDQLKATIEEAARDSMWADLTHCLPVSLSAKERLLVLGPYLKDLPIQPIEDGSFILSDDFVAKCELYFTKLIRHKAEEASRKERTMLTPECTIVDTDQPVKRNAQSAKGGFGFGAREIRTKNVKKKYNPSKRRLGQDSAGKGDEDTDSMTPESAFANYVSTDELHEVLQSELPADTPDEVISGTVAALLPNLQRTFAKILTSIFLPNSDTSRKRDSLTQTQDAVNNMLFSLQLMERGITVIKRQSLQTLLLQNLIKNQGNCIIDKLCVHIANCYDITWPTSETKAKKDESSVEVDDPNRTGNESTAVPQSELQFVNPISSSQRQKLIELLKRSSSTDASRTAPALQQLFDKVRSLQTNDLSIATYLSSVENFASDHLGFYFSTLHARMDSKRKRDERAKANELAFQVEAQLQTSFDAALAHLDVNSVATATLAAACLFTQVVTGWPVVAPGKCVPELIDWLSDFVQSERANKAEKQNPLSAVELFVSSSAAAQLTSLSSCIAKHMHSADAYDLDTSTVALLGELLQTGKKCRKLLYA